LRGEFKARAAEPEPGARASELGILPGTGAGAQIKNPKEQEPALSLKFKIGVRATAI